MITARFKFANETKGALKYAEIDEAGELVDMVNSKIGSIYLRKTVLDGNRPRFIEVEVKPVEMD